ncbi:hypothetical protein [Natronococcus wangiae]|uniref:hypothetical protein n=1 Tax=Natronococcus wangiae TaxID=3068275 RepID=UPI00273EBC1F|nr:hypothetical protein [Natronococcus sp. AD5]
MSNPHLHQLIEDTLTYSEKEEHELSIEEYRSLRRSLHTDILDVVAAEQSFFVLGSYNAEERSRLDETVDRLYNEGHAFLLDDTLDAWENWTTHFKIYADRATHIVGVFEHADGGHEWEAGYLDHQEYRTKTYILKRRYPSLEAKEEPFDGMMAHYMILVDHRNQLFEWDGDEDASENELKQSLLNTIDEFLHSLS